MRKIRKKRLKAMGLGSATLTTVSVVGTTVLACSAEDTKSLNADKFLKKSNFVSTGESGTGSVKVKENSELSFLLSTKNFYLMYVPSIYNEKFSEESLTPPNNLAEGDQIFIEIRSIDSGFTISGKNHFEFVWGFQKQEFNPNSILNKENFAVSGKNGAGVLEIKQSPPKGINVAYSINTENFSGTIPQSLSNNDIVTIKLSIADPDKYQFSEMMQRLEITVSGLGDNAIINPEIYINETNFIFKGDEGSGTIEFNRAAPASTKYQYSKKATPENWVDQPFTDLSTDDQINVKLVIVDEDSVQFTKDARTSIELTVKFSKDHVDEYLQFGSEELSNKIMNGDPVDKSAVFAMMNEVKPGDIIGGKNQVGMRMPSNAWADLIAPQADVVPSGVTAPYVDVSIASREKFGEATGIDINYPTIAFLQNNNAAAGSGYGQVDLAGAITEDSPQFKNFISQVNKVRERGGDIIQSFGGEGGTPIWQLTNDPIILATFYATLAKTGNIHQFDMDIEGGDQANKVAQTRNAIALRIAQDKLAAENFKLDVSLTLPVLPEGLVNDGLAALRTYYDSGLSLKMVNIMNMSYGTNEGDTVELAKEAITNTARQISEIAGISQNEALKSVSSTHWIPRDSNQREWDEEKASALTDWAIANNLGGLSVWYDINTAGFNPKNIVSQFQRLNETKHEPSRFNKDVDIYSNGAIKGDGEVVNNTLPPLSAINEYSSSKQYKVGDYVISNIQDEDRVYRLRSSFSGMQGPTSVGNGVDLTWIYMGTAEWYNNYYENVYNVNPEPKTEVPPYIFIRKDGINYKDPSKGDDTSGAFTWWQENAWNYNDVKGQFKKGEVYKFDGKVWIVKFWTTSEPGGAGWELLNASSIISTYWQGYL